MRASSSSMWLVSTVRECKAYIDKAVNPARRMRMKNRTHRSDWGLGGSVVSDAEDDADRLLFRPIVVDVDCGC